MEDNLGTGQAPINTPEPQGNIGRLENELEDLKEKARISNNPFEQRPTPKGTEDNGGSIVKIGTFLFVIAVLLAGAYILKSFLRKQKSASQNIKGDIVATTTPAATINPYKDWKKYSDPSGLYSFSYPQDFSITEYKEDGHVGVSVYKNEGFGVEYGKDYVKIKTLLLKGLDTNAMVKATQLRNAAVSIPGQRDKVSEVEEIKIGGKLAYKYRISSTGDMKAEDIILDVGNEMVRIEIEYLFISPSEGKYEEIIGKTLSSFSFSDTPSASGNTVPSTLPNTGIFSTTKPSGASDSSSFGDMTE